MKINNLLERQTLKAMYEQGTALNFEGPPGCGKSNAVRQIPGILSQLYGEEFGFHEVLAPTVDAPDVRGLCVFSQSGDQMVSKYTYPALMPSAEYLCKHPRGVYFIDEFAQAETLTCKAFAPTILEGVIGEHNLPPGWWVIVASNRAKDRSGANRMLMHIYNRMRTVQVDVDEEGWISWAEADSDIHPIGAAFVRRFPGSVFAKEVPAEPGPFCTQRSFTSMLRFLTLVSDGMQVPQTDTIIELCAGDIGHAVNTAFFAFAQSAEFVPTIEEIIEAPDKAIVPTIAKMDACYVALQLCLHHLSADTIAQIWVYLKRMPKEIQSMAVRELTRSHPALVLLSSELSSWIANNRELLRASVQ